jgi:hypothetical protein
MATASQAQPQQQQQPLSSEELTSRSIQRGAVEAVVWGMPAVNFERMLQAVIANGGAANQMLYWSRPVNWKDQALTPNPNTIYFNPFYDTTKGPVVLEIPPVEGEPSITGSIDDAWQCALADVGPAGVDQGKGGKYLITPPGYKETLPGGYIVVPSDTYQGFAILRSNFESGSDADIAAAVAYGKRMKIYPLGGSADQTVYLDVYDKMFDATIPYDVRFFESLNRFVQAEPWLTRDKVMIDSLKAGGIAKGEPFRPQFQVGVVGYVYRELGCDSGSGDRVGCFQSQVVGAGPQLGFIIPLTSETQGYLNLKSYWEFANQNRPDGWNAWVTFVISPAEQTPSAPPRRMITK